MPEVLATTTFGLPKPTAEEWQSLRLLLDATPEDELSIPYIAHWVMRSNSYVQQVIEHDLRQIQYDQGDTENDQNQAELENFQVGVQDGYEFVIGCFTYLYLLRSAQPNLAEYWENNPNILEEIPVTTKLAKERVKQFRIGLAVIDIVWEDRDEASSHKLAAYDFEDYVHKTPCFESLVRYGLEKLDGRDITEQQQDWYINGFYHGLENAVEMYIQSQEEQLGASLNLKELP